MVVPSSSEPLVGNVNTATTGKNGMLDKEACLAAVHRTTDPLMVRNAVPSMLSKERKLNVRDIMVKAIFQPDLISDWVETGTWRGGASLIAAITQRTAQQTPSCGQVRPRAIWLADSFEGLPPDAAKESKEAGYSKEMDAARSYKFDGGIEAVKQLFVDNGFRTDGSGDVPIYFLKGWFQDTLPNSRITDIAILRLDGDMYSSTLQALFALYRRVRVGGHVIIDDYGHWPQCKKAIDEFFMDALLDLHSIDYTGRWFQKNNTAVRVPPNWNTELKSKTHPKVKAALHKLSVLHRETVKEFVGHVVDNAYQSSRYVEGIQNILWQNSQQGSGGGRVNICETGFNGGHSAMLFMAFSTDETKVYYYGWDLGRVGSSRPVAEKMEKAFPGVFKVIWGDSKKTLKDVVSLGMDDQGHEQKCDLIVVDGEHSRLGVWSDLKNLLRIANPGALVFGDDCAPKNQEMLNAWNEYVKSGELISVANYQNPLLGSPGFVEGVVPQKDGNYVLGL